MSVLGIRNECCFAGDSNNIDSNDELCRFLLHWLFATNACLTAGKSNRFEFPGRLVHKIKLACPEDDGMRTGGKSN